MGCKGDIRWGSNMFPRLSYHEEDISLKVIFIGAVLESIINLKRDIIDSSLPSKSEWLTDVFKLPCDIVTNWE